MKRIFLFVFLIFLLSRTAFAETIWRNVTSGIDERDFSSISIMDDNPKIAYVASSGGVYKTKDGGASWNRSLDIGQVKANFVIIHPSDSRTVYAATNKGLYRTLNSGRDWERIFSGLDRKKIIRCVAIDPRNSNKIYIGTEAGLFKSANGGMNWQRTASLPTSLVINQLAIQHAEPKTIYIVSNKGLFRSIDEGSSWERVFGYTGSDEENLDSEEDENENEDKQLKTNSITIKTNEPDNIYLATDEGIFLSLDNGSSWHKFSDEGLLSKKINFLAFSKFEPDELYAATEEGVFQFSRAENKWLCLSSGAGPKAKFIAFDRDRFNSIWVAAQDGIYKTTEEIDEEESSRLETYKLLAYFDDEPSICEIQEAAIRYAEVNPEKIARWRKAARNKALLPKLTFGIDKTESNTYDIYTSSSTQYYFVGPEDETEGWDISLTWDLGDLIWNDDQTEIDVRSKLMVQLRDDILDEVTRYYFERRKLEVELLKSPPTDTQNRLYKELRLQELTANIDALTNGYLSKNIK